VGGRRARSLNEIVGTGLSSPKRKFIEAISEKSPQGVAASSANLLAKSKRTTDIIYYASLLTDFVKRKARAAEDLNYEERVALARREWSRIKKKENLEDDPVVTNTIVSAAAKAIAKGRK
jgi:hypothetical protein